MKEIEKRRQVDRVSPVGQTLCQGFPMSDWLNDPARECFPCSVQLFEVTQLIHSAVTGDLNPV